MVPIPKIGVMSCGFLLCLGLANAAQAHNDALAADALAADNLKGDQSDRRQGGQEAGEIQIIDMDGGQPNASKTITGEVLRVEGNTCFVKGEEGKEVRLHIDLTTLKAQNIEPGDWIEAKVNDQNHALSVLSDPALPNRRNAKD